MHQIFYELLKSLKFFEVIENYLNYDRNSVVINRILKFFVSLVTSSGNKLSDDYQTDIFNNVILNTSKIYEIIK